jgi:hypothetical protein
MKFLSVNRKGWKPPGETTGSMPDPLAKEQCR